MTVSLRRRARRLRRRLSGRRLWVTPMQRVRLATQVLTLPAGRVPAVLVVLPLLGQVPRARAATAQRRRPPRVRTSLRHMARATDVARDEPVTSATRTGEPAAACATSATDEPEHTDTKPSAGMGRVRGSPPMQRARLRALSLPLAPRPRPHQRRCPHLPQSPCPRQSPNLQRMTRLPLRLPMPMCIDSSTSGPPSISTQGTSTRHRAS